MESLRQVQELMVIQRVNDLKASRLRRSIAPEHQQSSLVASVAGPYNAAAVPKFPTRSALLDFGRQHRGPIVALSRGPWRSQEGCRAQSLYCAVSKASFRRRGRPARARN